MSTAAVDTAAAHPLYLTTHAHYLMCNSTGDCTTEKRGPVWCVRVRTALEHTAQPR